MVAAALAAPTLEVVVMDDERPDRSPVPYEEYWAAVQAMQQARKERFDHENTLQKILALHAADRRGEDICWCEVCTLARRHLMGKGAKPRIPRAQLALPLVPIEGGRMRELDDES